MSEELRSKQLLLNLMAEEINREAQAGNDCESLRVAYAELLKEVERMMRPPAASKEKS